MAKRLEPLTPRQQEIFEYVRTRILAYDPPTIREIAAAFGIGSPNGVVSTLRQLYQKGWLTPGEPSKARSLRITEAAMTAKTSPSPSKGAK